jgi:hypothetical protein
MHLEPHATLGWMIGNIGRADRGLRTWCVVGAILPDIDAASYLFGAQTYGRWHHTFGHNIFLWMLFVGCVTLRYRSVSAAVLSFLSFGSHLLSDAALSGWPLYLYWPISRQGFIFPHALGLESPINTWLVYLSFVAVILLAIGYKRTPVDIFSPKLDQIFVMFFRSKTLACALCQRKCNQCCVHCKQPICAKHSILTTGINFRCPNCASQPVTADP